jgi:hypothetical protein
MKASTALTLLLTGLLTLGLVVAQTSTGSLSGLVQDPNGAIVPNVVVKLKNRDTGQDYSSTSNEAGSYLFPVLPVGSYSLTVEHSGFKKLAIERITIAIAERASLNLALTLGDTSQSVDVKDVVPLLQTETNEVGTAFQSKFMQDGPLFVSGNLRNPQSFVNFMPGVNGGVAGSFAGSSTRSAEILIDGASQVQTESGGVADFGQFPSVEQFGEFRLVLNSFSAEYGRTGGGIQIFNTKSGTNQLHGQVFDFIRNDFFDAAGWGINSRRVFPSGDTRNPKKAKVRQQEWGFAVGGPVWIPKLYNGKNKTFFYFTFNGFDQAAGAVGGRATVATDRMRRGDFGELTQGVFDPLSTNASGVRTQFPGNQIPAVRFSSVSRNILPFLPPLANAGLVNNADTLNLTDQTRRLWSIKGDHNFNSNHRVNAFLSFTDTTVTTEGPLPGVLTAGNQSKQKPESYRLNYDWTVRPSMLNHVVIGFTRWQNFVELSPNVSGKDIPVQLGLRGVEQTGPSATFPNVVFGSGYNTLGNFQNRSGTYHWTFHIADNFTWVKGRHTMKAGFDFRRLRTFQNPNNDAQVQGVFNFEPFQTAGNNTNLRATTGHTFASFLLGAPDSAVRTINAPVAGVDVRYGYQAFFFQDNFRVNSRLTLELGLRWDIGLSRADKNGVQASLNPRGVNNAANGRLGTLVFVGTEGENRLGRNRFGDVFLTDFGPRIGFAYQLNSKTVLRGGYGISYSASNGLIGGGCFPCTFGVSATPAIAPSGFAPAFNWDGGFPLPANFVPPPTFLPDAFNNQNITYLTAADGRHARINAWSFNIQRELPGKFLVEAGYMANATDRLNARAPVNQVDPKFLAQGALLSRPITDPAVVAAGFTRPYASFNGTLAQSLRPFPQFLNIGQNYSAQGSANYNALLTKFEKRYSALSLMGSWVWSRTMMRRGADSSNCQCINPQNAYDYTPEYSIHTQDLPHVVNILWAYDLPFGKGKKWLNSNRAVDLLVGGWTLAGAQQYRSGTLIRPTVNNALAGLIFNGELRPNAVTGVARRTSQDRTSLDPNNPNSRYLDPAAFSVPAPFTFGNAAIYYNDFRNPPVWSENLGIAKRTRITEKTNFEVRADISNLFNRTNFGGIQNNISNPAAFGRPSGPQLGPRIIQMAGRFNF